MMTPFLLLLVLLAMQPSELTAVVQTAELDVYLGGVADASALSAPSYTFLASHAYFGKYPQMLNIHNPIQNIALSPSDNPLLCNNVSTSSSQVTFEGNTLLLVPRGVCTFETKAYHAQLLGAQAVAIYGTLASRYSLNATSKKEADEADVVYPLEHFDYDCTFGRAEIPRNSLDWTSLPYNAERNDPLLSGNTSANLCQTLSPDALARCPSEACLLTGRRGSSNQNAMEACCAWDLHIYLWPDTVSFNATSGADVPPKTVTIPAVYLTMHQGNQLLQDLAEYATIQVVLSERWRSTYNTSSYLIWALGVFVAALAAYLSADEYRALIVRARKRQRETPEERSARRSRSRAGAEAEVSADASARRPEESMELTAVHAVAFVGMATTSLLVLFYFKIYGVVKVLYAVGCSRAVGQIILDPLLRCAMRRLKMRNVVVWQTNTEDFGDITLRDLAAYSLGYAWGISWLVIAFANRHPGDIAFFWISQDIFGACMCIMFLQVIKLNSVDVASILLTVAFFYDIFFVFVSPLLFDKSVMITVATSGGPPTADALWCEKYPADKNCQGGDPLPMLFTIPRVADYLGGSSLLGLGDIILPGLLLSFAARLDAAKSLLGVLGGGHGRLQSPACPERRYCGHCRLCSSGYFPPVVVAYAIGLAMANAAVYLTNLGQPALLYLVPCCLGTMAFLGWRRGELRDLWAGPKAIRAADDILYGMSSDPSPSSVQRHAPLPAEEEEGLDDGIIAPRPHSALEGDEADGEEGDIALLQD